MPIQTTKKSNVYFPDGALVEVDNGTGYFDIGAVNSVITNTLEWTENRVTSSNAGDIRIQIRQPLIQVAFTLINLIPEGVEKLGGGVFTRATTTTSVNPEDQVQTAPQVETLNPLLLLDSSSNNLRPASTPTITSVTGSVSGALLTSQYIVVADSNSASGYSIVYETGAVDGTENVTIVYPSQTMIASEIIYMGSSTVLLTAYKLRFTHTDDNNKIRRFELFSVDPQSGGIQFNFKGAQEDGVEEMPLSFTGKLDSTATDGRQLAAWTIEDGAE